MNDAVSLFWSFGSLYFGFLGNIAVFGVSLICYVLGAMLIGKVIGYLIHINSTVSFRNRGR